MNKSSTQKRKMGYNTANKMVSLESLVTTFRTEDGVLTAVNKVSFDIFSGETLGLVGESGCGKSVTSLSILQLLPYPKGRIIDGHIFYRYEDGREVDIASLTPHGNHIRDIRGKEIAIIFQEPMTSLNPVRTIGSQIVEAILRHYDVSRENAKNRAIETMTDVGFSAPERRIDQYPHELSGGLRQRAMIAMALSCDPRLLIADEPTTALDVTIEAQILELMYDLKQRRGMSLLFITHDLKVIGDIADRVSVMYAGKLVESASAVELFNRPLHPYTMALLNSIPQIGTRKKLSPIRGSVPNLLHLPNGCAFEPRCPHAMDICRKEEPPMFNVEQKHNAKCWLHRGNEELNDE